MLRLSLRLQVVPGRLMMMHVDMLMCRVVIRVVAVVAVSVVLVRPLSSDPRQLASVALLQQLLMRISLISLRTNLLDDLLETLVPHVLRRPLRNLMRLQLLSERRCVAEAATATATIIMRASGVSELSCCRLIQPQSNRMSTTDSASSQQRQSQRRTFPNLTMAAACGPRRA